VPSERFTATGETPVATEKGPKPAAAEPSDDATPGPEAPAAETGDGDGAAEEAPVVPSPEETPGASVESDADDRHTSEPTDGGQDKEAQSIGDDVTGEAGQPEPVEENEPRRPARPVRSTPSEPTGKAAPAPTESRSPAPKTPQSRQEGPWGILLAVLLIPAIGLLVWMGVLMMDLVRSRPGKTDTPDTDEEEEPDRRELVAYAGGRKIALGPLAEVRRLDIGSGPRAAVPLTAEGVLPRHATLIRKGEEFRLRNRSRAPLTVNGVTLPARRSARIVLPADVLLDGETRVAFRVRMNPPEGPQPAVQGQS
ncbi:MAG: FHA domain-containing protein, partial [bacterium]